MKKIVAILCTLGLFMVTTSVNAAETVTTYISLGVNPYFQVYSDGELQKFTPPKSGSSQDALAQMESGRVQNTEKNQKNLVNLVRELQVMQSKQDKVFKGTLIQVVGPRGKKAQAYLENVNIDEKEIKLSASIRKEVIIIEESSQDSKTFHPTCYKATKLIMNEEANQSPIILNNSYSKIINSPIYVTYDEALKIVGAGDSSQVYAVNNAKFRISFTPIFTKTNNLCST